MQVYLNLIVPERDICTISSSECKPCGYREELGHQRRLIRSILEQMDKRFSAVQNDMDRRFGATEKRFEAAQKEMTRHFEAMQDTMNQRFDAVDKRFEGLTRRTDRVMIWSYAITLTVGGLVVAALKLLA